MNDLIPLEFKNQRIMTTSVIAEEYGVAERKITDNFNNNKERYKEGKHYFLLQGEELRQFKSDNENFGIAQNINKLYLWTEKGALLHAKSLNTDKAWEVYDILVDSYFNPKEIVNTSQLSPELQMFKQIFDTVVKNEIEQNKMKQQIKETRQEIQGIRDVVSINSSAWKTDCKNLIVKIAVRLGGIIHIQDVYKKVYSTLDKRLGISLSIRLTNKRRRMADEGVCKSKRDKLNYIDVISDDKKLVEGYIAIVKELAIKYGVDKQ